MVKEFAILSGSEDDSDDLMVASDDDEEIDEDTAFTAEDYLKYGDVGIGKRNVCSFDPFHSHLLISLRGMIL
ncbi:MAG: hypothetical protein NXI00_24545 [Cytophagales bacterium]|nr:hypothetical protein [Cytophagales bacterium]